MQVFRLIMSKNDDVSSLLYGEIAMPRYDQRVAFMADVRRANPTFERVLKSSLRPLINLLENNASTALQVRQAIQRLPAVKVAKYRDALWYLLATYPGIQPLTLPVGVHGQTTCNTARYTQTQRPVNYDPSARPPVRNSPPSAWCNMAPEQWLLSTGGTKGILLIHLSGFQAPMNTVFNGRSSVDHMNSVLRIGRLVGADLLCLHMEGNPVCDQLADAADAYGPRKQNLLIHPQHMGGRDVMYTNFAANHNHVLVMGFDADVCVNANLFGAPERLPAGAFVPPLTSLTNVVTSRSLLVTTGQIYPFNNNGEYGVLNAT